MGDSQWVAVFVWQGKLRDRGWGWGVNCQAATSSPCAREALWGPSLSFWPWGAGRSTRRLSCRCCGSVARPPTPDTSFMYMIAGLCMLKLYQKRHPDINASAYSAYACLAIVIFFSVLGVVRPCPALLVPQERCTCAHSCAHAPPHPLLQERPLLLP